MDRYKKKSDHANSEDTVLRAKDALPIRDRFPQAEPAAFYNLVGLNEDTKKLVRPNKPNLLVIHDGGGSWREYPTKPAPPTGADAINAMDLVKSVLQGDDLLPADHFSPKVIIDLNHLPEVERDSESNKLRFADKMTFWQELVKRENRDKVCLVCSANVFRRNGAAISRRLSWEQTIEDLAADLHLFDELGALTQFRSLIIRFGIVGAVHVMRNGDHLAADFIFAPTAKGGYHRDRVEEGNLRGENVMLTAELVRSIAACHGTKSLNRLDIVNAMKAGLYSCMLAFDIGYKIEWDDENPPSRTIGKKVVTTLFSGIQYARTENAKNGSFDNRFVIGHQAVLSDVLAQPNRPFDDARYDWDILRTAINPERKREEVETPEERRDYETHRVNVASAIVIYGHKEVLNRNWDSWHNGKTEDKDIIRRSENVRLLLERPPCICHLSDIPDYRVVPDGQRIELPLGPVLNFPIAVGSKMKPIYVPIIRADCRSVYTIPAFAKPAASVFGGDGRKGTRSGFAQRFGRPCLGAPQDLLHF
jgi:hypothetical protein